MDYEALKSQLVEEESPNVFTIKRDSSFSTLEFKDWFVLFKKGERCDTFNIQVKKLNRTYELMSTQAWTNKLVNSIQFDTEFIKQKYFFVFKKYYDASGKMELELVK